MKKKFNYLTIFIILGVSLGYFFYSRLCVFAESEDEWGLPLPYAQACWPSSHRDSKNSNYLPFITTDNLELKWQEGAQDQAAVLSPITTGPEGNIYFTTGKDEDYGNLHALDQAGNELWRSYLLDSGAFGSSAVIDNQGDLYLGDTDEFFSFHPDGNLKWKSEGLAGPFVSPTISLDGFIIAINTNGLVYLFDPIDGHLAADPYQLPGESPADDYKITPPPGLWEGMVSERDNLSISDLYNAYQGYQFKITKTAAVHPQTGRIYVAGTVKSARHPYINGLLYGFAFTPDSQHSDGKITLAFESKMKAGAATCPAISPDGQHIYVLDQEGRLYAFDQEGNEVWDIEPDVEIEPELNYIPPSPTIGPDGTIYLSRGSNLLAIRDLGTKGGILWDTNFNDLMNKILTNKILTERLTDVSHGYKLSDVPEWMEWIREILGENFDPGDFYPLDLGSPIIRSNSLVSASKNYLYLTLSLGYEMEIPGNDTNFFIPVKNTLITIKPSDSIVKPYTLISSFINLPDTSEGIITLGNDGSVFCTQASISSSVAYYISRKMGVRFPKSIGGICMFGPKKSQDLIYSQIEFTGDSIERARQSLRSNDLALAYTEIDSCIKQLKAIEEQLTKEGKSNKLSQITMKKVDRALAGLETAKHILDPMISEPEQAQKTDILRARYYVISAVNMCRYLQTLF